MSKELTEKWKNGTLKEGVYWCEITESPYVEQVHLPCCDDIVVEVLAPVPSYKEWKQLKELLRECREVLKIVIYGSLNNLNNPKHGAIYLLPKIDKAIGEK